MEGGTGLRWWNVSTTLVASGGQVPGDSPAFDEMVKREVVPRVAHNALSLLGRVAALGLACSRRGPGTRAVVSGSAEKKFVSSERPSRWAYKKAPPYIVGRPRTDVFGPETDGSYI